MTTGNPIERLRRELPNGLSNDRRSLGIILIAIGGLVLARRGAAELLPASILWPLLIVLVGFGAVVWQVSKSTEAGMRGALRDQRVAVARIALGCAVALLGLLAFLAANVSLAVLLTGLVAALLVSVGLGLVFGPWLWLVLRDLRDEQRLRLWADERAEVAAHLHDSVLQTLSLIQRTDDAREASQLARRQERELRSWLYGRERTVEGDIQSAIEATAAQVEHRYGDAVEVVVVGSGPLDEPTSALVAAVGEALTNAAKFAGVDRVSVYAEITPTSVEAFVRDTGDGFDPTEVADDRKGIAESIRGRMQRAGGEADITTGLGEGTEVHLRVRRGEQRGETA